MSQSADAKDRINSMGRKPPENAMRANVHLHVNEKDGQREKKRERERERENESSLEGSKVRRKVVNRVKFKSTQIRLAFKVLSTVSASSPRLPILVQTSN